MATHRDPTSPVVTYHSTLCAPPHRFWRHHREPCRHHCENPASFPGDASKTKDGHGISRRVDPGTVRAAAPAAPGGLGSATFDPDPQILNAAASR